MDTSKPLANRVAWVTGASRGLGHAIAVALAEAGAEVAVGARDMEALGRLRDVIAARGGRAEPIALDVESPESCAAFAAEARERLGLPSILVNNAGIGVFRPVDEFLPDEFERQFRVNVFGLYHMTRLALPLMKQAGEGDIVNVSSLAGESSAPRGSAYFATKHAVNGFTKCVMEEAREHGIRVMLLCPGSIDTRFHVDSHPGSHAKDQSWMLEARDVAAALVHAASAPRGALLSRIDARPARPARKK